MDYTPISAGRVLIAFALTAFVGMLPVFLVVGSSESALAFLSDASGGYGGLALGVGSIVMIGRRVVRRPFRA